MASPTRKHLRHDLGPTDQFDVTCVIGSVAIGETGEHHPHVAAFILIAQHDAPGTYKFPMQDGRECAVTVEYDSN